MEPRSAQRGETAQTPGVWKGVVLPFGVGLLLILVFLGLGAWLLNRLGVFDIQDQQAVAKIVAATLVLLGTAVTAVFSLVGLLVKRSMDVQAEKRLTLESEHNRTLQKEAEARLRMDTAIRAVALLGTPSGNDPPPSQLAGALFALASLDQLDLAIALLPAIWGKKQIESESAVLLLNRAFQSDSPVLQKEASALLGDNLKQLLLPNGDFLWPECIGDQWRPELPDLVREELLCALIGLTIARTKHKWNERSLIGVIIILHLMMKSDPLPRIQSGSALALSVLVQRKNRPTSGGFYSPAGTVIFYDKLLTEIGDLLKRNLAGESGPSAASPIVSDLVEELEQWAGVESGGDSGSV